jgi:alpha,alpha-trehalose phosphorylase
VWETPSGKHVRIISRRLVSLVHRHVAAIRYEVTLLDAEAPVVISSQMLANEPTRGDDRDPRQAKVFAGNVLHPRASYARDGRVVLCHQTTKSQLLLACVIDHELESTCPHDVDLQHSEDSGQITFTIRARPGATIRLTKYIAYHTSPRSTPTELCRLAEWTVDRVKTEGFEALLTTQERFVEAFWQRSDVQIANLDAERFKRSTVEVQQAIRFNSFCPSASTVPRGLSGWPTGEA